MATYAEILFGRVVLNNRLASHKQVAECLRDLRGRTLAEVMVKKGLLTPEQARQAQRAQALAQFIRAEKIFARILVDRRLIDAKTVRRAFNVQAQRQYKTRLAALLIEQGLLDAGQLEAIVDEQLVRLAEETARIEEQGLEGALKDSNRSEGFEADAPEDLGSVRMKNAVGPSGFIDSPRATLPMRKAAKLDDEPPRKRTMIMDSAAYSAALSESDSSSTMESSDDPLIGKLVASRYKVLEKVGVGGMGTVYRAEHCLMEKVVALKVLNPELVSSQRSLERFRHEIRAASRFQHRHVIQIYDAGEGEGGIFYMAMEFAEGEDLEAVIAREGALPLDRVLAFFRQTLEAVGEAHKKKIVHRDLKSGNLMVTQDKHGFPMIKIMDFGIAKIALEEGSAGEAGGGGLYRTQEGIVTGTPQYMSPEQASGEPVDHRSDLYSLGVILFEMLTGQLPFRSDTPMGFLGKHIVEPPPRPSAVRPELGIPPVMESIALRLLEKAPEARYQTAAEVIADMDARCTPEGLQASTSGSRVGAPLAMTIPARPVAAVDGGLGAAGSGHHGALGVTMEMPSGLGESPGAPAKKRRGLLVGLALGFLVLLTLSTSAALYLSQGQSSVEQEVLARAETLMDEGRFSEVEALLKPLQGVAEAEALLAKAQEGQAKQQLEDARAQVAHADDLVAGFRRGATGRDAAAKALRLYRDAQRWIDDEELARKIKALEERLGPVASMSPTPRPSKTPRPVSTPTPRPAASPRPTPTPAASPSPAGGQTQLYAASHALLEGRLDEAARLLEEAARGLPSDHAELRRLREYLRAEQLASQGREEIKAGRPLEGAKLLRRAAKAHPRAAARRELESEAQEAEVAAKEGGATRAATAAILALDPVAARKAIATAPDAEGVGPLEEAIKALERFAREWREARAGLAALAKDGGDPAEGTRLAQLLESVATSLEGFPEGALKVEFNAALTKERAAAKQLVVELRKRRDANKSDELRRFEASLAKYREQKVQAETARVAEARLGAAQDLQYAGAYRRREASPEDRSFVDKEVERWRSRMKVWSELRIEGGAAMIRVVGGSWTPPGGKPQKLPAVFYVSSHELTCEAWDLYVRAKNRKRPRDWPRAGRLREPVRAISLSEAKAYCRWLNQERSQVEFVVPDELMWERAARGNSGQAFPWGEAYEKWREGYAAVRVSALRPVGAFKRDHNDLGLFDVVGNVAELTRSREGSKIVIRGGSFLSARGESGAAGRIVAASGDERANHIGLRLFAIEKE